MVDDARPAALLVPMAVLGVVVALTSVGLAEGVRLDNLHNGLLALAFGLAGVWTLLRRPGHREGALLATTGLAEAVVFVGRQVGHGGTTAAERWAGWLGVWPVALVLALVTWVVIGFPEGRALSLGWRRWGAAVTVAAVLLSTVSALWPVEYASSGAGLIPPFTLPGRSAIEPVWAAVAHPAYVLVQASWVVAVLARWRVSNGAARRQLALTAAATAVALVALLVGIAVGGSPRLGLLATPVIPLVAWWALDQLSLARVVEQVRGAGGLAGLSPRENDVLDLMAQGLSNQAIADRLHLSVKTVEPVVGGIFGKLDLPPDPTSNRRVLAVLAFVRR